MNGGDTDGPLSPPSPPLPILPAPEKSEQEKTPEVLLQGDSESATSSSQEVAVVVPEIVQVLKLIEEVEQVVRMESLMDPLARLRRFFYQVSYNKQLDKETFSDEFTFEKRYYLRISSDGNN